MKRSPRKYYKGVLLKTIPLPGRQGTEVNPRGPFLVTPAQQKAELAFVREQRATKLGELFAHYEIDPRSPHAWKVLSLRLAIEHVPGFQTERSKAGAPIQRDLYSIGRFYAYARRTRASRKNNSRNMSDRALCDKLLKDAAFKLNFPDFAKLSAKRLMNILSEAKTARSELARHLLEWRRLRKAGIHDAVLGDAPVAPRTRSFFKKLSQ